MSSDTDPTLTRRDRLLLYPMAGVYLAAGIAHLLAPRAFEQVVPPEFPRPRALVFVSGLAEIVLGIGVLVPRTRRASAWGIVALLLAVFPANVYMATEDVTLEGAPQWARDPPDAVTWGRLPLQAVLVCWALRYTGRADETVD